LISYYFRTGVSNLFYREQDSKYFRLGKPYDLCHKISSTCGIIVQKQPWITCKWMIMAVFQLNFIHKNIWWIGYDWKAPVCQLLFKRMTRTDIGRQSQWFLTPCHCHEHCGSRVQNCPLSGLLLQIWKHFSGSLTLGWLKLCFPQDSHAYSALFFFFNFKVPSNPIMLLTEIY
jgi:hypothetical protein